jgi:transcriptional regulator with XRE-family HTH domain
MSDDEQQPPRSFIRAWRLHRGLSASELGRQAGYHHTYVYRIETGERRYDQYFLERVAEALRCRPADLIGKDPASMDALDAMTPEQRQKLIEFMRVFEEGVTARLTGVKRRRKKKAAPS